MNNAKVVIAMVLASVIGTVAMAQESILEKVRADYKALSTNKDAIAYMTDELWIQYANELIERGPSDKSDYLWCPNILRRIIICADKREDKKEFLGDFDTRLANAGFNQSHGSYILYFPKMTQNLLTNEVFAARRPVFVSIWSENFSSNPIVKVLNLNQRVNLLVEKKVRGIISASDEQADVKSCIKAYTIPIKRYLRENGKTFVIGDDGKNPVQDILDELSAGFASPNCIGVKQFLAKYAPEYNWIEPAYFSSEQINELKDKVFYGEVNLTEARAMILKTALGVDAYNEFIDSYNSDSK